MVEPAHIIKVATVPLINDLQGKDAQNQKAHLRGLKILKK